jgi:hypothetical protein
LSRTGRLCSRMLRNEPMMQKKPRVKRFLLKMLYRERLTPKQADKIMALWKILEPMETAAMLKDFMEGCRGGRGIATSTARAV